MVKSKKMKNIIVASIISITILELFLGYKVMINYKGVFSSSIFMYFILQPYLYIKTIEATSHIKRKVILIGIITLVLPFIIFLSLPKYSYKDGKELVKKEVNIKYDYSVIEFPKGEDTIPINKYSNNLFITDKMYYYKAKLEDKEKFFLVHPLTGEVDELEKDFFRTFD